MKQQVVCVSKKGRLTFIYLSSLLFWNILIWTEWSNKYVEMDDAGKVKNEELFENVVPWGN